MNDDQRVEARFYDDLDETVREAWRLLLRGAKDRRSPFHTVTLATLRRDGSPAVRTLVLRGVDPEKRLLRLHTDRRSDKFQEIDADPRIAAHFYDPVGKVQLRISGYATLHTEDQLSDASWHATRSYSRVSYRMSKAPGSVLEDPNDVTSFGTVDDPEAGREHFAAIVLRVDSLEWLYLAARGHRRALFSWRGDQGTANWLVP